jgi:hypothetical protein
MGSIVHRDDRGRPHTRHNALLRPSAGATIQPDDVVGRFNIRNSNSRAYVHA